MDVWMKGRERGWRVALKVENRLGSRRRGSLGRAKELRKEECRHGEEGNVL